MAERYLALRGEHASHPGTGKGYAAAKREERDGSGDLLAAEKALLEGAPVAQLALPENQHAPAQSLEPD